MDSLLTTIFFLLLNSVTLALDFRNNNNTESEERQPRVSGRIVKLYSGTRPEPIYCPQEGFQPDPADCAVFYRCVKGANSKYTVFRFQCGPGTVYDPETEVCNFPQSTKRSECGGVISPSTDRNNENEIEGFQPEVPSPIHTRPVYSEAIKESTTQTANPWATSIPEKTQSASTTHAWFTTLSNQETSTKGTIHSQPSGQEGDSCTKDGFMGDSENCRKFYRCVANQRGGFIRYEFSCSETTVWDDDVQNCNHPWAVQRSRCGRSTDSIRPSNTNNQPTNNQVSLGPTVQEQLQINYGDKVTQTQTQISHGDVIQNQTQINYPNRNNNKTQNFGKQNQTQISHGSAVSQTQSQINYGNGVQNQLQIDHTKESSQGQSQTYETTSKTPAPSYTTSRDEEDQGYGMQPSASDNEDKDKGNECTESGFMGDQNDCKKFYRCVDNGRGSYIKYEFSCGDGTVWDTSIEGCNHAWAVKECGGKAPQNSSHGLPQTTMTTQPTQNYQTTLGQTSNNEDTGYGNQNQQSEITTSSTTAQPNPISTTTLGDPSSNGDICTSSGFKGDPNDCKKFYRCVDNGKGSYTKYEYNCGEGTVWDSEIEACNHPWAVKKCGGTVTNTNNIETTTVVTTVSLVQTPMPVSTENIDYESGYGQQPGGLSTTTTKQPQSNGNNQCTSSGFMGDTNDCKKFYRCVDSGNGGYTRYEFSCGEGTVWDSKIEACNHAWAVENCGGGVSDDIYKETTSSTRPTMSDEELTPSSDQQIAHSTQSTPSTTQSNEQPKTTLEPSLGKECSQEGFMGDQNDCKKFYRCVDDGRGGFTKYEFTCGEGTVWDSEITACNHPNSVKSSCFDSSSQSVSQTPQDSVTESGDQTATTHSTEKPKTTSKPSTSKPSSSENCSHEGFMGDKENCRKFYRCVDNGKGGYTKYEFTCGDGTIWDQEIQACNHEPSDSKCSMDSQINQPQTEATDGDTSTSSTTVNQEATQKPPLESSASCSSEGFYANLDDCKKFYRCVDNGKGGYTKYDFSCGEGTMWVQEIQACDHDTGESCTSQNESSLHTTEAINLNKEPSSSSSLDNTSTQQPDKQEDETSSETSSKPISSGSSQSSDKCTAEGFYPKSDDCKKFYRCVDNGNGGYTKYDFDCGEGTAWDSDIQSCNHISEVKSCQGQEKEPGQPMQDEESTSDGNLQTSSSGPATAATESSKPTSKDICEQEGYYGNSKDCTKFYRCVDNGKGGFTKYDFACGEGTIWDQDITACNHPQDVTNPSCQQNDNSDSSSSSINSSTESTSSSSSSTSSSSSSSSSSTTESSSSDCSQGSTKKPDNKNVNCTKAGYYPDQNDCKKFYRCVDWDGDGKRFSVYHFECGEGTIWDPALDTCNHEDSVYPPRDCSGGTQSQGENVDQESSTTESTSATSDGTTQESTTVPTTTQESTTEQTTTSDQSTTQQSTTQTSTEEQTTQQTTTSEATTIQQSTTHESTTQQSDSTTQQTTTESITTQSSSTESSTTEKSTTESSTTESSTTEGSTTENSTTESSTTEGSTTEGSTTEGSTTEGSTTEGSTTEGSTTESSTTERSTTEGSTTESSTTESSTTEGSTTEGSTTESTSNQTDGSGTTETSTSTTENQPESTTESETEQTTQSGSSDKECPKTDDDQNLFVCPTSFRRHPKYCNMFYQCTEDDDTHDVQIATFHCPNNTIYDENKTKCVEEKKADKKCDGEIAQKRRLKRFDTVYKEPIVVTKERLKCPAPGHYPFEQSECSSAFLKCQKTKSDKIRGFVYQCPQDYVYWSVSRRCEPKSHVRDCKKSHNNWTNRWEIPIERRNVAPKS